jgi:hypothetical protein
LEDPNPEYLSAPGGKNYKGVVAVLCRGNGRDQLPIMIVNVNRGRALIFSSGRISAATVDYAGKIMVVQSRAGSPNRYIAGVYNFGSVSLGRRSPSMGEQVTSFPLLYQVGATPYWLGDRNLYVGMPMKPILEAERLLLADRVVDVCYLIGIDRIRCIGLDDTRTEVGSRAFVLPDRIRNVTEIGDLHVAATIGEYLYLFLLSDDKAIQTARLPSFEIPETLARTDRAVTVASALKERAKHESVVKPPIKRVWRDATGDFEVEAELVEFKDGQVKLKKSDGLVVTVKAEQLSEPDRQFLRGLK